MSIVVLNASREIIGTTSLKRAVAMIIGGAAGGITLADATDRVLTTSSGDVITVPPLIALHDYVHVPYRTPSPTRANVLARDRWLCQFGDCTARAATRDHVLPRSRGGHDTWENLVAACQPCNNLKGDRTPNEWGRRLKRRPQALSWGLMVVLRHRLPVDQVAEVAAI